MLECKVPVKMDMSKQHINSKLDEVAFWKGTAILMVILTHSHQMFNLPYSMRMIPMFGQMGCQLFFVLSCFGLCLSYERRSPKYFDFLRRRMKKISIGYWLTILVTLLLTVFSEKIFGKNIFSTCTNRMKVLENILFLHGLDPSIDGNNKVVRGGWFVGTLVIFYVLFPMFFHFQTKMRNKNILPYGTSIICMLSLVFLYIIDNNLEVRKNSYLYFSFVNQLPSFIMGFILYDWYRGGQQKNILSLLYGIILMIISFIFFHKSSPLSYIILPFVFSLGFVNIYKNFTLPHSLYANHIKPICCKAYGYVKKFGEYSYAIYLIHPFIAFELSKLIISLIKLPEWLLYILWLPILFIIILVAGTIYNALIEKIKTYVYNH